MHYKTFEALPSDKKDLILKVCIEEFAEYGYENASTNRIVKKINMSKGSLFKYFNTKEELYRYIIDYAVRKITSEMSGNLGQLPRDIFERLYVLAEFELDLYIKEPILYKLFKNAFNGKTDMSKKLLEIYSVQAGNFFDGLFEEIEFNDTTYQKEQIINLFKWVLTGYNEQFMEINANQFDVNEFKKRYLDGIQLYISMIRLGIDK